MMKNLTHLLGALVILLSVCFNARAGSIKIDTTVDLSAADFSCNLKYPCGLSESYALPKSILISEGDTVEMTVRFAKGQALQMTNTGGRDFLPGWLFLDYSLSEPNASTGFMSSVEITLFDNAGRSVLSLYDPYQYFGSAHVGGFFEGEIIPVNTSITFSSYRSRFMVESLFGGSQYYEGPNVGFYEINQGTVRLVSTSDVPEPSSVGLFLLGVGLLGGVVRKKR